MKMKRCFMNLLGMSLLALVVVWSTGCAELSNALMSMTPTAEVTGMGLSGLDLNGAIINVEVAVDNPGSIGIPLVDMDYKLTSGGTPFINGKTPLSGTIPARGRRTFSIPVAVGFSDVLSVLQGVRLGSVVPYDAELGLSLNTPVQATRIPLRRKGEFPIPNVPKVSVGALRWNKMDLLGADGVAQLNIQNTNEFIVELMQMQYKLKLANVEVASSKIGKSLRLDASGGTGTLEIPFKISPAAVGLAAFRAISGGDVNYSLEGLMGIGTPFGPLNMPLNAKGATGGKEEPEPDEESFTI